MANKSKTDKTKRSRQTVPVYTWLWKVVKESAREEGIMTWKRVNNLLEAGLAAEQSKQS